MHLRVRGQDIGFCWLLLMVMVLLCKLLMLEGLD
jgi:hypothetical protein